MAQSVLVGNYTILHEIGRGGMATVYLADDAKHGRQVAVKVLHPSLADIGAERFDREIGIVARLQHPHIVPLYDSGEWNGHLFYVMPFIDGETLSHRLTTSGPLSPKDALRTARDVAAALEYAHGRGVIHRDIKPSNVLLTADWALVADFGIARALTDTAATALTSTGVVGTPTYMSPEHAEGSVAVGPASDIYALGCLLHESLTGKPPYAANTFGEMIVKHVAAPVPSVRQVRPELSETLDFIVQKALAKKPADRWSAGELRQALEQEIADTPTEHREGMAALRRTRELLAARGHSRRVRRSVLAIGAAAVAIVAVVLWRPWRTTFGSGRTALNDSLVVVAPFYAPDPRLEVWREGFMDILSRNFDGAGPIRTVSPTLVTRQAVGKLVDRASAAPLAHNLRARFVVFGQLLPSGPDSVRAQATLYDAMTDSAVADLQVRGAVDRMDAVTDSLTFRALRELNRFLRITVVPRASLGSPSVPALKEFLQGEHFYRRNDFAQARPHYERALEIEPKFALALRRMRGVLRGLGGGEFDSLSFAYALRAGQANHGLSVRESLLVAADSLAASLPRVSGFVTDDYVARVRRRVAVLEQTTGRFPDDAEAWAELGEVRYHFGARVGIPSERALEAFAFAIRSDSAYGPAYYHAVELGLNRIPNDSVHRYVRTYLAINRGDVRFQILDRILGHSYRSSADLDSWLERMPATQRFNAAILIGRWLDSAETAPRMLRQLVRQPVGLGPGDASLAPAMLARVLLYRGHLHDAYAAVDSYFVRAYPHRVVQLALLGAIPVATANNVFRSWLTGPNLSPGIEALPWWSLQRDTVSIRRVEQRSDSVFRSRPATVEARIEATYGATAAKAHLALARGDSAEALRYFLALPDSLSPTIWRYLVTLEAGQLLAATGRPREAGAYLDRLLPESGSITVSDVLWSVERARIAARLGEADLERREYAFVARTWAHADSILQPVVRESQEALRKVQAR